MARTLRFLLLVVFTALAGSVFAQEISGLILDDKKQPLPTAAVQVFQGGILKMGTVTDFDGNYTLKPLDPGYYDVMVLYTGLDTSLTTGVLVSPNQRTSINITMVKAAKGLPTITVKGYRKKLIDIDKPASNILTKQEIDQAPVNQIADLVALAPGVYQAQRGGATNIGGARTDGTTYIIDGVVVQGQANVDMAQGGVDQLEVITSGIPANYGDVSGGIVNITSRGVSQKFTGDVRVQHSIDGYNNNTANFSIAGPLLKKRIDSLHKRPVLGFSLSGDYYDDNDRYPSYNEQYIMKPSALAALQQNPLKIITDNTGNPVYNPASDYITSSQLEQVKIPPHDVTREVRLGGKLDYQIAENIELVGGGNLDYVAQDEYNSFYEIFAPSSTPTLNTTTGRAFLRFRQKFGKANDTAAHGAISNAYYYVQGDYQKTYQSQQDPTFKHNIFDYGYVGTFNKNMQKIYVPGATDSVTGKTATILEQTVDEGISYNRSNLNPLLANYTSEYYSSLAPGVLPTQLTQIQSVNALVNGDQPNYTYGLFSSPGTQQYYYSVFNSNQYALTLDASFDLQVGKTKHAIEFGLYYQQRVERSFTANSNYNGVGTSTIWQLMRGLVSSIDNGNLVLDKTNPLYVINGVQYTPTALQQKGIIPGPTDTIIYQYKNIGSGQNNGLGTTFDQNLRKELGLTKNQDINIDALAPSTFSLGLFSADELLNSGNPFVSYYGYTYTGGNQGSVSFNDFWLAKDANGNYTRPIAAFTPNYIAGYLLDKFNYKDVHFNVGVRIDRYDANTNVLIDPYSEYAEETISQYSGSGNAANGGVHPANLPGNAVVYVDNNTATSPTIVGYRAGNNWYGPTGQYVADPSVLTQYTGGGDPQPVIVKDLAGGTNYSKITDPTYNPNSAFTNYTPQISVQPRVSFNFPISEVADFYAHYDVYSHRPTSGVVATAYDYTYLDQNSNQIVNNANLKPEQTIDYEVGFQQKLSDHSALTLSAYYKERKDQIAIQPYLYAFPTTYYTYGNRDFSTTNGTTVKYDLRATNHLSLELSYTLQFAEGTGSTPYSTNSGQSGQITPNGLLQSFIEAGLPNLRYVSALDYDSRHDIKANLNYRYGDGEGPIIGGLNVLQNAGIDVIGKARSGEPYTRYSDAEGNTVIGGINGSRLPWHYGMDLRMDKDFALTMGKRHKDAIAGVKPKRPLFIKAIIQANNVLNTRDILHVYGYTGKPNDNGYLTSSYGQQYVPQQQSPATYTQLYQIYENNPSYLNYARTVSFALQFDF